MFRILLDDMIKAQTVEELANIMHRHDGIEMAYKYRALTESDYKMLVQLYGKLMEWCESE